MSKRRQAVRLVGAQVVGQVGLLAAIPVLTRSFTPSDLGLYQLATSIAMILQPVASLRVEFLIPVSTTAAGMRRLIRMSRVGSLIVTSAGLTLAATLAMIGAYDGASISLMTAVLTASFAWTA